VGEGRQDAAGHPSSERVSVAQAADHLGTTVDAIRKRVQRGTIPYEKDPGGRVWIVLDTGRPRQDNDRDTTGRRQDTATADHAPDRTQELIATLREQLEAERQAHAEARRLLLAALERIPPQLEAPSERPQAPETATDEQQGRGPIPDAGGPQEPSQPRPWWQRMFGG